MKHQAINEECGAALEEQQTHDWTNDELCASLIEKLQAGKRVETREYLRPIFKWCKGTGKHSNPQKAFAFAEWMLRLQTEGDASMDIPCQPHIHPNYAFNTIIAASLRTSMAGDAMRAYKMMRESGYRPDVFTLTPLLALVGRNVSFDEAWAIYEEMKTSETSPNVVTYVTMIRLTAHTKLDPLAKSFAVLEDAQAAAARSGVTVDTSIFNAVLVTCVRLKDVPALETVLQRMNENAIAWNRQTYDMIGRMHVKLHGKQADPRASPFLEALAANSELFSAECLQQVQDILLNPRARGKKHKGCLGPETSLSVRQEVIQQDMWKLVERFARGSDCVRTDFETIIHQCKKRKWPEQVVVILDFMQQLGREGFPEFDVTPKPSMLPDVETYKAALDAYISMEMVDDAWNVYQEALQGDFIDEELIVVSIHGFLMCGRADLAVNCYWNLRSDDRLPNRIACQALMRSLGRSASLAVDILNDIVRLSHSFFETSGSTPTFPPFSMEDHRELLFLLLESCAALRNPAGLAVVLGGIQGSQYFQKDFGIIFPSYDEPFVMAYLMAALSCRDQAIAHTMVFEWQGQGILPKTYLLHTLVAEAMASCPASPAQPEALHDLQPLPFKGFSKAGALKYLDGRRMFLQTMLDELRSNKELAEPVLNFVQLEDAALRLNQVTTPIDMAAIATNSIAEEDTACDVQLEVTSRDLLMDHYIANLRTDKKLSGLAYLHHAHCRLLRVRDKRERSVLLYHLEVSSSDLAMQEQIELLVLCLEGLDHLLLPARLQSRLMSLLAAKVGQLIEGPTVDKALVDTLRQMVGIALARTEVQFDIIRDLTKVYKLHESGKH